METNYIEKIMTQFKNVTLNSEGIERDIYEMIGEGKIFEVINLMENNEKEVDKAIAEYNVQTHKVMSRPNKPRKDQDPYITEKLPRNKQQYINEIELFFLLGKPLTWKKNDGDDDAYKIFLDFFKKHRMHTKLRTVKRIAGSETECALIFNLTRQGVGDKATINVKPFIVCRTLGYKVRPLFDQYGDLVALAYGYRLRRRNKRELHWDILTKDFTFKCTRGDLDWNIETYDNPTGKINAVYFRQTKAWDGVVQRIEREESLDSKVGDTNNYFADPKAAATADVVANILDPDVAGQMVQLNSRESRFEYINPPTNSVTRQDEKNDLARSIFFDTFTPDFSYESIKGLGTLSGSAIKNSLVLGYIKRDNRTEIYGELFDRLRSVIFGILMITDEKFATKSNDLDVECVFTDPFVEKKDQWDAIIKLYGAGLCSLETAVKEVALVDDIDEEIDRIKMAVAELEYMKNEAQGVNKEEEQGNE